MGCPHDRPSPFFLSQIVQKWGSHFRPPFEHFWGPQKCSKIDPGLIFRGLGGGPKNGPPSRAPKSEILLLFTTLELGPTSQKWTPFWVHFGDLFSQKNEKRGFLKSPQNQSPKTFKMGPKQGGGNLRILGVLLPERSRTSIFHYFGFVLTLKSMFLPPC